MKMETTLVISVTFKYHRRKDLRFIKKLNLSVSDILATNVIMYQRQNSIVTYIKISISASC